MTHAPRYPGHADLRTAADALASRLPAPLAPLARVAYNYRWSWTQDGPRLFHDLAPHRFEVCGHNPVRLLTEISIHRLRDAAADPAMVARVDALARILDEDLARPPAGGLDPEHPVAFFCAEFGVHGSLPLYAGGLGILAGDLLKEASDRAVPMVGVSLLYRFGYFHQRLDTSGWQLESWVDTDPALLPAARVTGQGAPLHLTVPLWGREVAIRAWRVDVGRVPLYLLDTDLDVNRPVDRWITSRLYEGNEHIRLAQYGVLGMGGIRLLDALGIDPSTIHMNEGHAALAAFEMAARDVKQGASFEEATARARSKLVFTTHTPVPAGNERHSPEDILSVFPDLPARLGVEANRFLAVGRIKPEDLNEWPGLTALAIRTSRAVNGVSRRHGEVARAMWQPLFPRKSVAEVPIRSITNGVHLPTWMAPPIRELLDRHLPAGWTERAADPATWEAVRAIPDEELWAARSEARRRLVDFVRGESVTDRLRRGEPLDYVEAAARSFNTDHLIVGFARRLATYKRLHLLILDAPRALALLDDPRPLQLVFAGKAHPRDEAGKQLVQTMFRLKGSGSVPGRVAFLEDYDMDIARVLVSGCDVWVNLPRPPLEASGTSGMKAALNGVLNLSVLDGWWPEAYDGQNGWAIDGSVDGDDHAKDARDAAQLYSTLEREIVPLFYQRDEAGLPRGWIARIKASLATVPPMFCASRMVQDYVREAYR